MQLFFNSCHDFRLVGNWRKSVCLSGGTGVLLILLEYPRKQKPPRYTCGRSVSIKVSGGLRNLHVTPQQVFTPLSLTLTVRVVPYCYNPTQDSFYFVKV